MFQKFFLFIALVLLELVIVRHTLAATSNLAVRLIDHVSKSALGGQVVSAYEKQPDGSLIWRANRTTDAAGLANFDLDGLGSGKVYILNTQPFGSWVSREFKTAGLHEFPVGTVRVKVLNGRDGSPYASSDVTLLEKQPNGSLKWNAAVRTDSTGQLKLDPPQIGVRPYVLRAISKVDGNSKDSPEYAAAGSYTFTVGGAGMTIHMTDFLSKSALGGQVVSAYEKQPDGSLIWRANRTTDAAGLANFDLDGLGSGKVYILNTQPFGSWVSREFKTAGLHEFPVGTVRVKVLNGRDGSPYASSDVTLLEKQPNGSLKWNAAVRTDSTGQLKLDPPQIGVRPYVLRAISKVDGNSKDSPEYAAAGSYTFTVGGAGMTIHMTDFLSKSALGGQVVSAYEKQPDGSLIWRANRTTDAAGLANFDLDGLGSGKVYILNTQPFGSWVSREFKTAGLHEFPVGTVRVKVLNGRDGSPYASSDVTLLEKQPNGSLKWNAAVRTDSTGQLKLDPPQIGVRPYVLRAISKVDGNSKDSPEYAAAGSYTFTVGGAGMTIHMTDFLSKSALGGQVVSAYEKQPDGSLIWRANRTTDAAGLANFDLDGLGSGKVYILNTQPFGSWVSREFKTAGLHEFPVGTVRVKVLNGRDGSPYASSDVTLLEKQPNGSLKWNAAVRTDSTGQLKLDPPQIGVRPYVLRAISKVDGNSKDSPEYAAAGSYTFTVGGAGMTIHMTDFLSKSALGGQVVSAYEKQPDGSLIWRANRTTDAAGLANFDLDGLGSGKVYILNTQPFGSWVSREFKTAGLHEFPVGTTSIILSDADNAIPLGGKTITAFEKLSNGAFRWAMSAITDSQGRARFDLNGVGEGAVYGLWIKNPFGENKDYFSNLLTAKGVFPVAISRGKTNAPDKVPPKLQVVSPVKADQVVAEGFRLEGTASDDVALKELHVILTLPGGDVVDLPAAYNANAQTWMLDTGALPDPTPGRLHVLVRAVDTGLNVSEVQLDVALVDDVAPPVLSINSPQDKSRVPTGAFMVSGTLKDTTLSPTLSAKVTGGGLPAPEERVVEVTARSGRWSMVVAPDIAFSTSAMTLTLTARDRAGNVAGKTLTLYPDDIYKQAWHVLQRTAFSGGPDQLAEVVQTGPINYIQQQLSPGTLDDSAFSTQVGSLPEGVYLSTDYLRHALYSRKQLQEVMTAFWDNHFSTYFYKHNVRAFELDEMAAFRTHALGNFRDLLEISAKSPAMLYTLDGITNYMGNPNENYARELMELHTLGVAGGYTQTDVEEVARAFTGWTVKDNAFYFNAAMHDNGTKRILGTELVAGGGLADGDSILDLLARHPSTANRLCSKLVTLFVSDVPVAGLVSRCSTVFLAQAAASDQIAQVLWSVLNSPEFLGPTYRGQKFKTPLELAVSSARNLGAVSNGDDLAIGLATMGMNLYTNASPTGYAETGNPWISSGQLLSRVRYIDRLLAITPAPGSTQMNLLGRTQAGGLETAEGVTGYLLQSSLGPTVTKAQLKLGLNLLTGNGALPYSSGLPNAEARLRQLEKVIMALPEYQYQ